MRNWAVTLILSLIVTFALWQNPPKRAVLSESVEATPMASAAPSAYPSPSPTATPRALVGYCLNVPILLYHHVQPQDQAQAKGQKNISVDTNVFEGQMAYLKSSGYTTLTGDQLAHALADKQELPKKSIVLTFDDGYDDFYTNVYPVIQKYGLVANLMVSTGLVNNAQYLSWGQIREMVSGGLVHAYNHTWSHANLTGKPLEKIRFEIMTANQQLKDNLGKDNAIFTYPYGSSSQAIIDFLKKNGFTAAFSTLPGNVQCDSFIMTLHRNRVGNSPLSSYGL